MDRLVRRKVVIVNQATNYLTVGFANAFVNRGAEVALITGSIHIQVEELDSRVSVSWINKWRESPVRSKLMSYFFGFLRIYWLLFTRYRSYEVLFVSLPPMSYILALFLSRRCSVLIWDVYPDVFKITGMTDRHIIYRICSILNRWALKRCNRIFTIGNRMAELLTAYVARSRIIVNPIWATFQSNGRVEKTRNPFVAKHGLIDKFVVQYSGNIGFTHKVEVVVQLAERLIGHPDILFQIIGRGPRMKALERLVQTKQLPNCVFLPFQEDDMFPYSLSAADLGVVILDDLASSGSVPSKCYNLMSFGIPSLYVTSKRSELADYAATYQHAFACEEAALHEATAFIIKLKDDPNLWTRMSRNAEHAAKNYTRQNADLFVQSFFEDVLVSR